MRGRDVDGAAEATIREYGREIQGFLIAVLRNETEADEVFSLWCEDLWRGLDGFGWASSLRTWLYVLARHAMARHRRGIRGMLLTLEGNSIIERAAAEVRTPTRSYLHSAVKNLFTELRRSLPEEDQVLLVLRIDRGLEWQDIARAMLDEPDPDDQTLRREAARLRKRLERLRADLVAAGRKAGLIKPD